MQESDIKVVRGLSITVIVLSSLAILLCALLVALFLVGGLVARDYSLASGYVENRDHLGLTHGLDSTYNLDASETSTAVTAVFGVLGALSGFGIVLCAVSLIAGIIGVRNCSNPQKINRVFCWSIAGAICSILMFRIVSCVLMIINAVYANRLRKAAQVRSFAPPQQSPSAMPGAAPQQPFDPVQGAAPQQPVQGVQASVSPEPNQPVSSGGSQQPVIRDETASDQPDEGAPQTQGSDASEQQNNG